MMTTLTTLERWRAALRWSGKLLGWVLLTLLWMNIGWGVMSLLLSAPR
jgi:hypothetical protein